MSLFSIHDRSKRVGFGAPLGKLFVASAAQVIMDVFGNTRDKLFLSKTKDDQGNETVRYPDFGRAYEHAPSYMGRKLLADIGVDEYIFTRNYVLRICCGEKNEVTEERLQSKGYTLIQDSLPKSPIGQPDGSIGMNRVQVTKTQAIFVAQRMRLIKYIFEDLRATLNKFRGSGRSKLYYNHFFVVRMISDLNRDTDVDKARAAGFWIDWEWPEPKQIGDRPIPKLDDAKTWNIPQAYTESGEDGMFDDKNEKAYETMALSLYRCTTCQRQQVMA